VTDKIKGKIFQFDSSGNLKRTVGRLGANIDELVRPKGIAVDSASRIWVVDAGVSVTPAVWSTEVAKIYDAQGRLLLFFGQPGNEPGRMNLPAKIVLDRRNVNLFQSYAVPGAKIEFLVLVSNQYGTHKINVYGFGEFPAQQSASETASKPPAPAEAAVSEVSAKAPAGPEKPASTSAEQKPAPSSPPAQPPAAQSAPVAGQPSDDTALAERIKATADLYLQSLKSYRAGDLTLARMGFLEVIRSGLIPPPMVEEINGYLKDIDSRLASGREGQP
jgi:hypothetical protein